MEETRKPARKSRTAVAPKPAARKAAATAKTTAATVKTPVRKAAGSRAGSTAAVPVSAERDDRVRMAAYFRAERRGFAPGYEWDDWLAAEAEVNALADTRPVPKQRKAPAGKPRAR